MKESSKNNQIMLFNLYGTNIIGQSNILRKYITKNEIIPKQFMSFFRL